MSRKQIERDAMLVLTIIGTFLSILSAAFAVVLFLDVAPIVGRQLASGNWHTLTEGLIRFAVPTVACSAVLVGTWFAYRRYNSLLQ